MSDLRLDAQYKRVVFLVLLPCFVISLNFLDPINWPKQIVLIAVLPFVLFEVIAAGYKVGFTQFKKPAIMALIASSFFVVSAILGDANLTRTLWGTWGRSNGILTLLSLVIIVFVFSVFARSAKFQKTFLNALSLLFIPSTIYGVIQASDRDPISWSTTGQVFSFFGNTNFASSLFAICAGASLMSYVLARKSIIGWLYLSQGVVAIVLVFLTDSIQGIVLIALISAIMLYFFLSHKSSIFAKSYLMAGFVSSIFVFLGFLGRGPFGQSLFQYTLELRTFYWTAAMKAGLSSPIFGVGVDSFGDSYRQFRTIETIQATTVDLTVNNAHNSAIQIFATLGIIGFLGYAIIFLPALFFAIKYLLRSNGTNWVHNSLVTLFIAGFLVSMISIDNIAVAIVTWALCGAVLGIHLEIDTPEAVNLDGKKRTDVRNQFALKTLDDLKPIIVISTTLVMFAFAWFQSSSDREILQKFNQVLSQGENQNDELLNSLYSLGMSNTNLQEVQFDFVIRAMETTKVIDPLALNVAERALEKYPLDFGLMDRYAVLAERLGRFSEAAAMRERQLDVDPRHPRVWAYYAYNLKNLDQIKKAAEAAQESRRWAIRFQDQGTLDYLKSQFLI